MKRTWFFGSRHPGMPGLDGMARLIVQRHVTAGDEVITGGAAGFDAAVMAIAPSIGASVKTIEPDWKMGRGAANARNVTMARECDEAAGLWNPASATGIDSFDVKDGRGKDARVLMHVTFPRSGTWHSIVEAMKHAKKTTVYIVLPSGTARVTFNGP